MEREQLTVASQGLGFDQVGVCAAQAPPHWEAYEQWLQRGYHAEMAYMETQRPLRRHPEALLPGVKSIIAVALNYHQTVEPRPGQPRIARYAQGRDYHKVMRGRLRTLAGRLQRVAPDAQFRPCVDSAPIFERDFAQLAGLGWFGKNTMLIHSERGSYFFIGLLLTTLEIEPDRPSVGGCGTCRACIEACPTGAIIFQDGHWQVDARRCISYLTIEQRGAIAPELAKQVGGWTVGCDVCQEVCPFNQTRATQPRRAQNTLEPDFRPRSWPNLKELAQISEVDWDTLTQGSAVRRVGLAGIRRNAHINIENQTDVEGE